MKRHGNLYAKIISIENLEAADIIAQRGKSKQKGVIEHNKNRELEIIALNLSLKNKTYKTGRYSNFTLKEPKVRKISRLPYYPSRIVHWAIMLQVEAILVNSFISQTYSCIKSRGILKCSNTLTEYLQHRDSIYCLKIDIRKFYQSINKDILKYKLRQIFKDEELLWLLNEIIDSYPDGCPLGNLLSQYFGNIYLNEFDHWLKDKKLKTLRYCDDIVILHHNKYYLQSLRRQIQEYLLINLKLTLSNYQVFPIKSRGIDYVGYVHFKTHKRLRKSIKKRFVCMTKYHFNNQSFAGYNGWLVNCNAINLKNKYYGTQQKEST